MDAAIYVRISQDRNGEGLGVARQEEDCRALAERLGWTVTELYTDNDLSAFSGKPRPAYRRLLSDIDSGKVGGVIVWHTDRLHRSPTELEEYVTICEKRQVVTQTVHAGRLDLATPTGRMVARILGSVARQEVEHKAERTRRAQQQAAKAGKWLGGARPFGWETKPISHNEIEAQLIREACAHILAGGSLSSVAASWNELGVTSTLGKPWLATTVRQTLIRARNAGLSTWKGEVVGPSLFPAIVDEETWRGVVAVLTDPSRKRKSSVEAKYLLAGIGHCECGALLRSNYIKNRDGSSRVIYRCRNTGSGHVYINTVETDAFVVDVVAGILEREELPVTEATGEDPAVKASALQARLAELADSYADGEITRDQLARATSRVLDSLADAHARLAQRAKEGALAAFAGRDGAERWRSATIDTKRTVLRQIADVTVMRSGRGPRVFDPARVQVEAVGTRWPAAER